MRLAIIIGTYFLVYLCSMTWWKRFSMITTKWMSNVEEQYMFRKRSMSYRPIRSENLCLSRKARWIKWPGRTKLKSWWRKQQYWEPQCPKTMRKTLERAAGRGSTLLHTGLGDGRHTPLGDYWMKSCPNPYRFYPYWKRHTYIEAKRKTKEWPPFC